MGARLDVKTFRTGWFVSRDPSGYGGGINLYSYVENNPGNLDDPMGLCGGDDAEPGFWDAVTSGLNVGLKATASALSFNLYDGGDAKCDPSFGTSKTLAGVGRDAAIMAATLGTGGPVVAEDEGAGALEDAAEGAERPNPCGWPLCFTADAPVQMADGTTRRIVDVQVGDTIKSRNPLTGLDDAKTVTATIKRLAPAVVTVSLTDARTGTIETLTCTPEHPFFVVGQGWVEAGSLGIGTSLVSRAGPVLSVTNVTWQRNAQAEKSAGNGNTAGAGSTQSGYVVYNLTVEDDHTFFVGTNGGGTWVHNINCLGLGKFIQPEGRSLEDWADQMEEATGEHIRVYGRDFEGGADGIKQEMNDADQIIFNQRGVDIDRALNDENFFRTPNAEWELQRITGNEALYNKTVFDIGE